MNRFGRMNLALVLMLLMPAAVSAQQETAQTKEGEKYIGLAMTRQDHAGRVEMYTQAMTHLRPAMTGDAQNARVWLLAGTALAGMGQVAEANSAFERALQLNPAYAEQIDAERFDVWIRAFQRGLAAMESELMDSAQQEFELAEQIYTGRPEALMYLGVIYANHTQDIAKADAAFRAALAATQGPLLATLEEEERANWAEMRTSLEGNIERIAMQVGIEHFQAERFAEAAESFKQVSELNPHSRDVWFNWSQALLAEAQRRDDLVATMPEAEAAAAKQELLKLYAELETVTKRTQEVDPNSEVLYMILARSHRMQGEYGGTEATLQEGQREALATLQAHENLPVTVERVSLDTGAGAIQVTGVVKNRKLAAGAPVQLQFTLLGADGAVVGEQTVTVNAPAAEATAEFSGTIPVQGEVAGWKYTVVS
ncbi:MAG: tetratricopeptide repeat protein [Gemmatimonadota bacterium]